VHLVPSGHPKVIAFMLVQVNRQARRDFRLQERLFVQLSPKVCPEPVLANLGF
jgi:hypothetical protein